MQARKVLGLDPGLGNFGFAVLEDVGGQVSFRACGLYESKPDRSLLHYEDFYRRCEGLGKWLTNLVEVYEPDAIAVEAFSYPRQSRAASMLSASHGLVCVCASSRGIPLFQIKRSRVLQVVGANITARGSRKRRVQIKSHVVAYCHKEWPAADWPKARTKQEHPADAAVTALTFLEDYAWEEQEEEPDVITSWDTSAK